MLAFTPMTQEMSQLMRSLGSVKVHTRDHKHDYTHLAGLVTHEGITHFDLHDYMFRWYCIDRSASRAFPRNLEGGEGGGHLQFSSRNIVEILHNFTLSPFS